MTAIFLTEANLTYLKHGLRLGYPHVGASHRLEALAAALSFRTYAALKAALAARVNGGPALVSGDPGRFAERLEELGYPGADAVALPTLLREPELPDPTWRVLPNRDIAAQNRWFRQCERRNVPYVWIELRRKYAKLNWDCVCVQMERLDYLHDSRGKALLDALYDRFCQLAHPDPGKSEFHGSAFVGSVDRLLPDIARDLADEFFMLLYRQTQAVLTAERLGGEAA